MAPNNKRNSRQPSQPQHSDIDTDTAALTDPSLPLPPKTRTNTELNLLVLRRYHPSITHILQIAPFAVVYTFTPESGTWEKQGTEGTLFVCQLAPEFEGGALRYNVLILNRKSLENFVADLTSADDVEVADPYVILQVRREERVEIFGLWIFDDGGEGGEVGMQELVAGKIQECAFRAEEGRNIAGNGDRVDKETVVEEYGAPEGYGHAFGLDGGPGYEAQIPAPAVQPAQTQAEPVHQPVDLLRLFGKAPGQQDMPTPQPAPQAPQHYHEPTQPPAFASNADTDFFRNSQSPAVQFQQHQAPPPSQQSALLDLFKNTRPG